MQHILSLISEAEKDISPFLALGYFVYKQFAFSDHRKIRKKIIINY